jgi:hypothetical protein
MGCFNLAWYTQLNLSSHNNKPIPGILHSLLQSPGWVLEITPWVKNGLTVALPDADRGGTGVAGPLGFWPDCWSMRSHCCLSCWRPSIASFSLGLSGSKALSSASTDQPMAITRLMILDSIFIYFCQLFRDPLGCIQLLLLRTQAISDVERAIL